LQTTKIDLSPVDDVFSSLREIFELHGIEITIDQVPYIPVFD